MSGLSGDDPTRSYSASSSGRITHGAAVVITERLAEFPDLALPSSLYKDAARPPAPADVLAYLQALLQKDPAAFLGRYGSLLQSQELNHFEALRSADFEVDHWLGYFATQRLAAADQAADPRRLPARVKNRRLAAMRRLAAAGEYFSDAAMRHRAPLLYHQQIGQFDEQEQQQHQQQQDEAVAVADEQRWQEQQQEQQRQGHAEGPRGGLGGSCLAAALRQTLLRDAAPPPAAATAAGSDPSRVAAAGIDGTAAAAAASGAAEGGAGGPAAGQRLNAAAADHPAAAGASRAAVTRRLDAEDADVQMDAPGPRARAAAEPAGGTAAAPAAGGTGAAAAAAGGGSCPGRPAGRDVLFSEFLMRQDDEAQLVVRRLQEQREEDAQMSEHDSDDDEDKDEEETEEEGQEEGQDGAVGRQPGGAGRRGRRGGPSALDRAQLRRDFVSEMHSRFLLGQDGQYVDYSTIDADTVLDGDWLEEETRDAEEKYFDED